MLSREDHFEEIHQILGLYVAEDYEKIRKVDLVDWIRVIKQVEPKRFLKLSAVIKDVTAISNRHLERIRVLKEDRKAEEKVVLEKIAEAGLARFDLEILGIKMECL